MMLDATYCCGYGCRKEFLLLKNCWFKSPLNKPLTESKHSSASDVGVRSPTFPWQRALVLGVLNPPKFLGMIDASRNLSGSSLCSSLRRLWVWTQGLWIRRQKDPGNQQIQSLTPVKGWCRAVNGGWNGLKTPSDGGRWFVWGQPLMPVEECSFISLFWDRH